MKKSTFLLGFLVSLFFGCTEPADAQLNRLEYQLGNSTVVAVLHEVTGSDLFFFNMHDDENTAVDAGRSVIELRGGRLLELQHSGGRLVSFEIASDTYKFDPNRIFTPLGITKTLDRYSQAAPPAVQAVQSFSDSLISDGRFGEAALIVTLHNNGEGEYSAESYLPEGEYATDAEAVHIQEGIDPDDFFFVTEEQLFQLFKSAGHNVVLQANATVTDDGSLSVWAGREGIPYINVEAQHGHLADQVEMILEVYRVAETHFN
jgi:hypothetical protein